MLLAAGGVCLAAAGCGESPTIRQYEVTRENEQNLTSELLRRQFPPIPFRWKIPEAWQLASNDEFSLRAWKTGPPTMPARITLGRFPAASGIPAQIMRWRRQLGLPAVNADAAMKNVTSLKTENGTGSFAAIEGATETILAFILPIDDQFWIFRFRSHNSTAESDGDSFRSFCESLEYVMPVKTSSEKDDSASTSEVPSQSNSDQTSSESRVESSQRTATETEESDSDEAVSDPPASTESDGGEASPAEESSEEGKE